MDGKEKVENLYLSTANVQRRQNSWKVSSADAQVEVAAQTTVHAVRIVCGAQSCAHVMAMKIVKHIQLATQTFYVMMTRMIVHYRRANVSSRRTKSTYKYTILCDE